MLRRLTILACLVIFFLAAVILSLTSPAKAGSATGHYPLGCLPTPPEILRSLGHERADELRQLAQARFQPASVDLSGSLPPIGDQGQQGSCVSWGVGYYYKTYQECAEHGWNQNIPEHQFSPAFLYNQLSYGDCSAGTTIYNALEIVTHQGVAPLSAFPYDEADCSTQPTQDQLNQAFAFRSKGYEILFAGQRSADLAVLKAQLAAGDIFVIAYPIYDWDPIVDLPTEEQMQNGPSGLHCVAVVGYDNAQQRFKFANSWGTGWGYYGYGYLTYGFVQYFGCEAWAMTDRTGDFADSDDGGLVAPGVAVNGTVWPASDNDTFYFDAQSGRYASIEINRLEGTVDPYVRLYAPNGQLIAEDDNSGRVHPNDAFISLARLPLSGRYSVVASSSGNGTTGTYSLSLSVSDGEHPDLQPYTAPGYTDPIVVSAVKGTREDGLLYGGRPTYVDWHAMNSGGAPVNGTFKVLLKIDGVKVLGYSQSNWDAGYWWGADDVVIDGVQSGWHTISLTIDPDKAIVESDEANNVWEKTLYWGPPPLKISTTSLPAANTGSEYSATLQAVGGTPPYSWSIQSGNLPPGCVLSAPQGVVAGSPGEIGDYSFRVQVADSNGAVAAKDLQITVKGLTLAVQDIWTSDQGPDPGVRLMQYYQGDPILYSASVSNRSTSAVTASITFRLRGPDGSVLRSLTEERRLDPGSCLVHPRDYWWTRVPATEKPGVYTFSCKVVYGSQASSRSTSLSVLSFVKPIEVQAPNGFEVVQAGSTLNIRWFSRVQADSYRIKYSTDGGRTWGLIASQVKVPQYAWEVKPAPNAGNSCLIKVVAYDAMNRIIGSDKSDHAFTVKTVNIIAPNGGEELTGGSLQTISWSVSTTARPVARVRLMYSKNAGDSWLPIATISGSEGSYQWKVPAVTAVKPGCLVRVVLLDSGASNIGWDDSDAFFRITPGS